MGLFNKLKNALFEEEEIDLGATSDKVVINDEEAVKPAVEKKEEIKPKESIVNTEKEIFKAENTFNFPDFDEEEFVTSYEPPKEIKPTRKIETRSKTENLYTENKTKSVPEKTSRRRKEKSQPVEKSVVKSFRPSPVISPVYGILDKNYKKEDYSPNKKTEETAKIPDVDTVRKKAFGTLEEDIVKTLNEKKEDTFYNKEAKNIDDLLNESIDDTIELDYTGTIEANDFNNEPEEDFNDFDFANSIEEELDKVDENLEFEETNQEERKKEKNEYLEEDTLESDLFDLIDSMYDDREEE